MRSCPRCRTIYSGIAEYCAIDGERLIESEHDPLIGTTLDRYRIEERLGDGGMACVYRARHLILGREVAIKLLFGEWAADKQFAERFRREAQAASRIDHPNVIKILDFGNTPEGLEFIVMDLLRGRPLSRVLSEDGPLGPARTAVILRQIATGLGAAHRAGFIHRDLKPGNVMITERDREEVATILDFGVVRMTRFSGQESDMAKLTRTGHALGTPHYMAPEQVRGDQITPQTDLYSLGVVLYEMLCGTPPFRSQFPEVLIQHATEAPPPLPASSGLDILALRLLAKEPQDRPTSAEALVAEIDRLQLTPRPASIPGYAPAVGDVTERASGALEPEHHQTPSDGMASAALVEPVLSDDIITEQRSRKRLFSALGAGAGVIALSIGLIALLGRQPISSVLETAIGATRSSSGPIKERPKTPPPDANAPEGSPPTLHAEPVTLAPPSAADPGKEVPTEAAPHPPEATEPGRIGDGSVEGSAEDDAKLHPLDARASTKRPARNGSERLDDAIEAALNHRNLSMDDIANVPTTARALGRYRALKRGSRPDEIQSAANALIVEINHVKIDVRLVQRKIERASRGLRRGPHDAAIGKKLAALDPVWIALRDAANRRNPSDAELRRLLFRTARFERDLNAVRGLAPSAF